MQRYFREWDFPKCLECLQVGAISGFAVILLIFGLCSVEFVENVDTWPKYQQAKMDARTFRSTMCRIEDIIIEETRPNENKRMKTTSIKGFFLLKVINSTTEQDQFRLAEVPLLHKSGQHTVVNSSLTCFYDPKGVEQARLTIPNLSKAKRTFILWCFLMVISSITLVLIISYYILILFKKIRQFITSRHRVTAPIAMQPINFA